jgi:hypothetical protein
LYKREKVASIRELAVILQNRRNRQNKIKLKMNIDEIFNQIKSNPKLAYSIIATILTVVLIGYIKRWKWATDPTGHRKSMILVEWFGYENYRKIMIFLLSISIIAIVLILLKF